MPSAGMGVNTGRKTLSEFLPRGIKAYSLPYYHARGGIIAAPSPCFRVDGLEMPPRMTSKKIIVALDIETTGLNPDKDAVIEIGMIRCRGDREEARWSSFVHPGCRIPPVIIQLTGITDAMVADAPGIKALLPQIREFVGDAPVLGHNVAFDMAFFKKQHLLLDQDTVDTLELASALLPRAPRYN